MTVYFILIVIIISISLYIMNIIINIIKNGIEKTEKAIDRTKIFIYQISKMDIQKRKGILSMTTLTNNDISKYTAKKIKEAGIYGIIITKDNIKNNDIRTFTYKIRKYINSYMLIAIDQDMKYTQSIFYNTNFKVYPKYIGEKESVDYAYKIAYERSKYLLDLGINLILGPVCNIYTNKQSHLQKDIFSNNEKVASKLIYATVKAQHDAGIVTSLKYFPVFCDEKDDIFIEKKVKINNAMLETFLNGIKAGAEIVLISNIKNVDKYKKLLYDDMKFEGVIMTDYINISKNKNTLNDAINIFSYDYHKSEKHINKILPDINACSKVFNHCA